MAILKKINSLFWGCLLTLVFLVSCTQPNSSEANNALKAQAVVQGTSESQLSGTVTLTQIQTDSILPLVRVQAEINGLPANTKHGFHIHQKGSCEPDFNAALCLILIQGLLEKQILMLTIRFTWEIYPI
ncbi:Superoxide dismutase (Cu-Zn) [Planktothrix tepida]|uniref:Superoxide dismutase (Cu-Zn) n=2 Tax=Planktothrix TaxID=54304 RepID=A0A1J1LQJ7_9CYAN